MTFEIKNKVCLVTGANRGIGKAIVETFLNAGASKVYAGVRKLSTADPLVAEFGTEKVIPIYIDLSDASSITEAAKVASDVQVVVNNGGILVPSTGSVHDGADIFQNLQTEIDVNVYGLLRMAQAFAPMLTKLEKGEGSFIQLNSVASLTSFPSAVTYSASKAAAFSLTKAIRDALEPLGVVVLSIHPGPIDTDMATAAGMTNGAPASVVGESILQAFASDNFLVFPDEIAQALAAPYQTFGDNVIGNKRNIV
jgi:NAD(P)-dependent dehydrogenase (short-subunit alcohol dehydrogenase family)